MYPPFPRHPISHYCDTPNRVKKCFTNVVYSVRVWQYPPKKDRFRQFKERTMVRALHRECIHTHREPCREAIRPGPMGPLNGYFWRTCQFFYFFCLRVFFHTIGPLGAGGGGLVLLLLNSLHLPSPPLPSPPLPSPPLPSPRLTSCHLTSPHLTSRHLTLPDLASRHVTSPHLTSPHLTSPHLTSPHLTSPHLTSPHLTSPHLDLDLDLDLVVAVYRATATPP